MLSLPVDANNSPFGEKARLKINVSFPLDNLFECARMVSIFPIVGVGTGVAVGEAIAAVGGEVGLAGGSSVLSVWIDPQLLAEMIIANNILAFTIDFHIVFPFVSLLARACHLSNA